ncbi:MAG: Rrf2 family transcriptional regulator [Candidatus Methanomethylophilus sp.]|jgi:Rrf2 family protein|nr:HTH domain-containing protein [methanogenic archaeon ISO4-H5]MBO5519836.1 Rrf2 family transcriptional regulator [Methanomethylophilus sp.]MBO5600319.1 Rrf2 family transcriptional regulator [Methanomethylophilus sp.]
MGTFISTKGRYAIRFLIDLAEHADEERIPLKDVAERQKISLKYLETFMPSLVKAGLVSGSHGKGGGYSLLRSPSQIMIGTVLRVTEGSIATVACLENGGVECERAAYCKTLPMWRKLDSLITEYLDSVSLQDLIDGTSTEQAPCPFDILPEDSSQL